MRISTDQGMLEAGSLEPGMKVWRDGWRKIEAVSHEQPRPGLRIATTRGLRVEVTPEHRLMHGSGNWLRADQLKTGDCLQLIREECPDLPCQRVPWPADGRVTRAGEVEPMAFLDAPDGPAVTITERWGRLLGLFTGDGSMKGKTAIEIACDGQDEDLIKLIIADFEAVGLRATTEQVTTYSGEILRRRNVRVSGAHLSRFLAGIGAARPHSAVSPGVSQKWERTLLVPDVIFKSPQSVRAAFLAGLFEADGHTSRCAVILTTKSADLARDVQRLLWSLGVPSSVSRMRGSQRSPYADRIYWQVRLRRRESELFAQAVGFLSGRKQARLTADLARRPSNATKPLTWSDEIVSVERCFVTPVDIQVEGEAFSAAGVLSHNSHVKALEYAALGIPVIASDAPPYRDFVIDGVTGFLVRNSAQLRDRLNVLASDERLRESMGAKAREAASAWTSEARAPEWDKAYRSIL